MNTKVWQKVDVKTPEGVAQLHTLIEEGIGSTVTAAKAFLSEHGVDPERWGELRVTHLDGSVTTFAELVEQIRQRSWRSFLDGDVFSNKAN